MPRAWLGEAWMGTKEQTLIGICVLGMKRPVVRKLGEQPFHVYDPWVIDFE